MLMQSTGKMLSLKFQLNVLEVIGIMLGQKLQNLIEESQSLSTEEKLLLTQHLLSDLSEQNITFPTKLSSKHILVWLPDSLIDAPALDINAVRAAQALVNKD